MQWDIAVCRAAGEGLQWVDEKGLRRLAECGGIARVVKTPAGRVTRATLHAMPGETRPSLLSDYKGTKSDSRRHLEDGHRCYRLRSLGDIRNGGEHHLAPEELRPIFVHGLCREIGYQLGIARRSWEVVVHTANRENTRKGRRGPTHEPLPVQP